MTKAVLSTAEDIVAQESATTVCQILPFRPRRAVSPKAPELNSESPFAFQDAMRAVEEEVYGL